MKMTPPRSIFYTCALSFPFFIYFFFFFFFVRNFQVHTMIFPIHQIHNSGQLLKAKTHAEPDSPCLTLCNFHLHLHAWHNSGHREKNHNTEAEKSIGMSSLQKNKSKLLYVCIVITLEYFNSFTIDKNTHIKKNTLIPNKA